MNAAQAVAAGIKALPGVGQAFAATQAAWRFFANPRVTLPKLVEPLRDAGRKSAAQSESPYALLVHDWSKLDYDGHTSKTDQIRLTNEYDRGYDQATALLVDAATGDPLAPMEVAVKAADGMHTTRYDAPQPAVTHREQVLPTMHASRAWEVPKTLVHVIDREADSLNHYRQWHADGHFFLVRANDRRATYRGELRKLSGIIQQLQADGAFAEVREIEFRGRPARQFVAETEIVLAGPAWSRPDGSGNAKRVPGPPLTMRFIVAQVRDQQGQLLAEWLLLTNLLTDVTADRIALWYYWRWRIESFHKLLKSAGLQTEFWQQESATAIAKRLLVACMACVVVWQLERQRTPEAQTCQKFLVRLSGRQTKRRRSVTTSALLAGLHVLVVMLDVLQDHTPEQLRQFAYHAFPLLRFSG